MPVLVVGHTEIPYEIRRSSNAKRRHVVVTPGKVEVVVPVGFDEAAIESFVFDRRRWIFIKRQEIEAKALQATDTGPCRFVTGAKIPFRGRQIRLTVSVAAVDKVEVSYHNGFIVSIPANLTPVDQDNQIRLALKVWFVDRLTRDVDELLDRYCPKLGIRPLRVRIKTQKHLWGSCGLDKIINLNWHLIFVPKSVLAYAVIHELCHLLHRNHSDEFWRLVGSLCPDYDESRRWLQNQKVALNSLDTL
jgi:hypothetical protein